MPSGRTHDIISLSAMPFIGLATYRFTQDIGLAIAATSGHIFSSFWLNPDLDIHSNPFKRWGLLRFLWLPYQKQLKHRSIWSHGILTGTIVRLLYLGCAIALFSLLTFGVFIGITAALQFIIPGSLSWLGGLLVKVVFAFRVIREALLDVLRLFAPGVDAAIAQAWTVMLEAFTQKWQSYAIVAFVGLEFGAACHYLADTVSTYLKRNS